MHAFQSFLVLQVRDLADPFRLLKNLDYARGPSLPMLLSRLRQLTLAELAHELELALGTQA